MLITALDETAWLFNMRGGDVNYNPIFVSYGLVSAKEAFLFVDAVKVRVTTYSRSTCSLAKSCAHIVRPLISPRGRANVQRHNLALMLHICSAILAVAAATASTVQLLYQKRRSLRQVTEAAAEHLKSSGVTVKPYEAVLDEVRALGSAGKRLWVDPAQVPL